MTSVIFFERRGAVESPDDEESEEIIARSVVNMTVNMYEDFLIECKKYELEFNRLRDELVDQYDKMVQDFISLYCDAMKCSEEEWNAKMRKMIPSKEQFRDSFKLTVDRAPLVFTSDDLGEFWEGQFLGKALQMAFSLARYLDNFTDFEYPLTAEAISAIQKEIRLLSELNVTNNEDVIQIISFFKEIGDLIAEGECLGYRSKGIVRIIKEKVVKIAVERNLLKMIEL
ncbi:hypothetical protein [Neobacillus fumarioli]|uniref:hypothetical protein n=1 Tax=Neobacillus fumarioli TaxID=105229 RepID=UPI00082D643E|nr:hypothetical protein [Neobacillus fumarioli]